MKQIKIKNNSLEKGKPCIEQYLLNNGIKSEDLKKFMDQPDLEDLDNPALLNNIDIAAKTIVELMNKGVNTFVQVDSDTDGYTSSAMLINYLSRRWPMNNIVFRIHPDKSHGVVVNTVFENCDLVIIPDAGSNQIEEHKQLKEMGKTVIVLDHHIVSRNEDTPAIIVNNQISEKFTNKYLSGAGIVYMLLKYLDEYYPWGQYIADDYLDLAAVGIIADAMLMTTIGNNYIAYHGLRNIKNPFLKELIKKQERGINNPNCLTKTEVAFYIAPVINGCIRSGEQEDKEMLFKAMVSYNNEEVFESSWRGVERQESLYEYAVRLATNAKSRQDNYKKKAFNFLCDYININKLNEHNIIIVPLNNADSAKVTANLTGLVAMELVKKYNKPVLVLRDTEYEGQTMFGGSGRNGNFFKIPSLLKMCKQLPVYYAEGHDNAFGIFITPENIKEVEKYFDENLTEEDFVDLIEVDYYFQKNELIDVGMLYDIANHDYLWGSGLPQPKLAFDVHFTSRDVKVMGKDKSSVKIKKDNIDFVLFKDVEFIEELSKLDNGVLTIVGRPQINEWMGRVSIQLLIDEVEIIEKQENLF